MRNIKSMDLITVLNILGKANVKQKLVELEIPKDITDQQYGVLLILTILEGVPEARNEIIGFLADIGGVNKKELEEDEFDIFPEIVEHLMNQKKFTDFLSKHVKQMQ